MLSTTVVADHGAGSGNVIVNIAADVGVNALTGGFGATALTMTNSGTGTATATVLGTLSGTAGRGNGIAASYSGTLNVGNGGTTGTLIGDVVARGTGAV